MRAPVLLCVSWIVACGASEPASTGSKSADAKPAEAAPKTAAADADKGDGAGELEAPPKVEPDEPGPALEDKPIVGPPAEDEPPAEVAQTGVPPADTPTAAETPPPELTATAVSPTDASAPWREVARPADPVKLEPMIRGVIASSPSGYYDVDDTGALVLRKEIETPAAPMLGWWPDNAWYVETRTKTIPGDRTDEEIRQIRLMRLRGEKRWVPQAYDGEQRFEDDGEEFSIGGKGGMLVLTRFGTVTRIAGTAPDPTIGAAKGRKLTAVFEAKSGQVYTVHEVDGAQWIQKDCPDQACVTANATKLPHGRLWEFTGAVPRQRFSISAVATAHVDGTDKPHLLHYETGGWKLEEVAASPVALWPTKDGGLWTRIGDDLLHRDPDGAWRKVALPEGAGSYSVAMRGDFSELWIAADVGGGSVVYATHANAQQPAREPTAAG